MDEQDQNPRHLRKPDTNVQPVWSPSRQCRSNKAFPSDTRSASATFFATNANFEESPSLLASQNSCDWINLYLQALFTKSEIELKLSQCKIQ